MTTVTDLFRFNFNFGNTVGSVGDMLWRDQAGHTVAWIRDTHNTPPPPGVDDPVDTGSLALPTVTPDWHIKAVADFNAFNGGFGGADILWQNDSGALVLWSDVLGSVATALPNPGPTWHVVGDNDFNGDTRDDILFRNDNGSLAIWTMQGPTVAGMFLGTQNPGPTWHVVGTGDTNGDGKAGILWQNDNGAVVLWEDLGFGSGTFAFLTVAALPTPDPSWHVKGMADFDHDGHSDIVFQNNNGAVVIWEMDGTSVARMNTINFGLGVDPGPAWHIVGMRDMDGDGRADILLQNDNGAAALWEDYTRLGGGVATFLSEPLNPNPNPNGHVWDLL